MWLSHDHQFKLADIQKNQDNRIDQDFPGYPHNPSREKIVHPTTSIEKATANLPKKDIQPDEQVGSASNKTNRKRKTLQTQEQYSDGSANAFQSGEGIVIEEKNSTLRNKKRKDKSNYWVVLSFHYALSRQP